MSRVKGKGERDGSSIEDRIKGTFPTSHAPVYEYLLHSLNHLLTLLPLPFRLWGEGRRKKAIYRDLTGE